MKNINENVINKMKKIVKNKSAMKIDGVMVDLYTASAVTKIYDIVNPANKKKMEKMSPQGLATAAFKILGKKESVDEEKATPEEKAELALKHAKETESLKDKQGREKETLMQKEAGDMGSYLGMDKKQKMKFDQLMKKLDGGKEHMKFRRMAKTPVQGDDMFHGYVKDLVTGAIKEATGVRQSGPIVLSKERKAKLVKVYDTLKVGDVVSIKFKRGGYQKQIPIRRKEVLRTRNRGWTRITFGDGVYLYKDPEEGRVVYAHGNMPSEVMDLIKESLEESVKISFHSKGAKTKWMKKQAVASKEILNQTPTSVELPSRWKDLSKKKDHDEIFSVNETVELEEKAITLGGTNGTGGEIFMGDKGIQKMIALSKKNPNIEYTVKSDNLGDFKAHWLKNGKFARRTVANINFDMDKNAVRGVPKGKTVKSTIFVLRYGVNEGVQMENDEYDNEGGMALQQLKVAKDAAMELCDIIKKDDNLPEWVQSKLTKAVDYMDSVRDYMSSKDADEYVTEINDARKAELKRQEKAKVKKSKLDLVSKQKKQAIDRLKSQKRTAKMGGDIAKNSEEMKRLNKTYADKVQKIMQEENVDESMARARADARRHMGGRGAQRGMAPLKKDVDNDVFYQTLRTNAIAIFGIPTEMKPVELVGCFLTIAVRAMSVR